MERPAHRPQDLGEEIANVVSHGIGLVLAVAALPVLVAAAVRHGSTRDVVAVSVFAQTMILVYFVSTLYHALPEGRMKALLNRVDHATIYLFIAGTYTAFSLGFLKGAGGWLPFAGVWALAGAGFVVKLGGRLRHPLWSTALYVGLGWIALGATGPLLSQMSGAGLRLLLAGGAAYTLGAVVFLFDSRLRYTHFVWHLFTLAGSGCHVCAALWQTAPAVVS
jgi:hemolysin III